MKPNTSLAREAISAPAMNGMPRYEFELNEKGQGPAVLMLPGSYATPAAWKGIERALSGSYRLLSTCLPGYGTTPEVRTDGDPDVSRMIEFVGQVVDAVDEPLHVVGHSWGAQLALAAVMTGRIAPISLTCFEANPLFAQRADGAFAWRPAIEQMVQAFENALAAGDLDAAAIIIDFYSRDGAFGSMPDAVRSFCRESAPTNLRDWYSTATFTPPFAAFSTIDLPVTLVRGSKTPQPIIDLTDELSRHMQTATVEVVEEADHFLISTHAAECARILEESVENASRLSGTA